MFSNPAIRNTVLAAAKCLKNHPSPEKIRILKFFLEDERQQLKQTRAQCEKMTQAAGCAEPGKKQYVVTNGKIMEKDADGNLKNYNHPITMNQPKNEWVEGHVVPCIRRLACGSDEGGG